MIVPSGSKLKNECNSLVLKTLEPEPKVRVFCFIGVLNAPLAELVDVPDLGSGAFGV